MWWYRIFHAKAEAPGSAAIERRTGRMRSPHKTTKQLSSTNLIFSLRKRARNNFALRFLSHLLDLLPSLGKHEPQLLHQNDATQPARPPPASSLSTPTIYKVANVSKLFLCHNKLFICNVVCRGSSTRLRRRQSGLPNGTNGWRWRRRRKPSSEVHKCRILDNMIQQWSGIEGEERTELLLNNTRLSYRVVETSVNFSEGGVGGEGGLAVVLQHEIFNYSINIFETKNLRNDIKLILIAKYQNVAWKLRAGVGWMDKVLFGAIKTTEVGEHRLISRTCHAKSLGKLERWWFHHEW